jgi:hypothetical protein
VADRPQTLSLAAASRRVGDGVALPGRFDAVRIATVRRYPGCPAGVRALCLSLILLGLVDSAALPPLAFAAAAFPGHAGLRVGLGLVALAGIAATVLIVACPASCGAGAWSAIASAGG